MAPHPSSSHPSIVLDQLLTIEEAMRLAIDLSWYSITAQNGGPFGAVLLTGDGRVLSWGYNQVVPAMDPTQHAEINAIRHALTRHPVLPKDTILVTSCKPCPMCFTAFCDATQTSTPTIYYANTDEDADTIGFGDKELWDAMGQPIKEGFVNSLNLIHLTTKPNLPAVMTHLQNPIVLTPPITAYDIASLYFKGAEAIVIVTDTPESLSQKVLLPIDRTQIGIHMPQFNQDAFKVMTQFHTNILHHNAKMYGEKRYVHP